MEMIKSSMDVKLTSYGLSDRGLVRKNNEDAWKALESLRFFVLADGMGGHQAGEIASRTAVDLLCELIKDRLPEHPDHPDYLEDASERISQTVQEVNRAVHEHGCQTKHLEGMGTTLCCLLIQPAGCVVVNVGDSRLYRLRNLKLKQITQDHSLLRDMLDRGSLTKAREREFQYRHILTKAIGTEDSVAPSSYTIDVQKDDLYLLCSDGLTDLVSDTEIQSIANLMSSNPQSVAHALVNAAKDHGGHDNITVVAVYVNDV